MAKKIDRKQQWLQAAPPLTAADIEQLIERLPPNEAAQLGLNLSLRVKRISKPIRAVDKRVSPLDLKDLLDLDLCTIAPGTSFTWHWDCDQSNGAEVAKNCIQPVLMVIATQKVGPRVVDKETAAKLKETKSYKEVTAELRKSGVVNSKSKKPLTLEGVRSRIRRHNGTLR